jgi:hypothetical protein
MHKQWLLAASAVMAAQTPWTLAATASPIVRTEAGVPPQFERPGLRLPTSS